MSAPNPTVIAKAIDWQRMGRRLALATVIQTWGSAPQPVGSPLLIDSDGHFLGLGCGGGGARACGGAIRIHLGSLAAGDGEADGMLHTLAEDIAARRPVALLTHLA